MNNELSYINKWIIQIGSHIGNTQNDPIFNKIDKTTKLILVEPVPYLFNLLKYNYSMKLDDLTNIIFINKACSNYIGEITLHIPSEKNNFIKLPVFASQLASSNPLHASLVLHPSHLPNFIIDTIKVKTTTLDKIIKKYLIEKIDLLHTDTEGHDYTILMNYSFIIKPFQILFENSHMDGTLRRGKNYFELCNKLLFMGYTKIYEDNFDTKFELNEKI
jgi:FkbM family methyltransferase